MKYIVILFIFLLIPLAFADTTFFDNPDNSFIMGNSATGEVIVTEEQQTSSSGGGCNYKWNCTNWGECLSFRKQIRECINIGTCPDTYKTPEIERNCTYNASEIKEEGKVLENETEKKSEKGIINKDRMLLCFIIILIILSFIFYLEKDYFKRLIKNLKNIFFLFK